MNFSDRMGRLAAAAAVLAAIAGAAPAVAQDAQHGTRAGIGDIANTADAKFAAFLRDFRQTALDAGIRADIYDNSMAGLTRNARVEELNLQQPEFVKPVWSYLDGAVSDDRIAQGQQMLAAHAATLARIENKYGVAKEILVAIWGIETNYGKDMGSFNMFEALATLAYDGPRQDFGRHELLAALKMEQQEGLSPSQMTSSWAGAFGNTQFVPSSFLDHAVDGDGDGKRDLWHSPADALASTASLLADGGWTRGAPCTVEVTLPANFAYEMADPDQLHTAAEWKRLGVTRPNGADLPADAGSGAILLPGGWRGPAFLVFDNFRAVLKYNNAVSYALAVCLLAHRMRGGAPVMASWPRDEQPLNSDQRLQFQTDLKTLGYDPGALDGVLGHKARAALRVYQKDRGLPADGFPTLEMMGRLNADVKAKG